MLRNKRTARKTKVTRSIRKEKKTSRTRKTGKMSFVVDEQGAQDDDGEEEEVP